MLCPSCNAPNRDDAKFCKTCGHSFRVEATKAPEVAVASQLPTPAQEHADTEDPGSAPTQIISPQQMVDYHNRRWQQELEREQTNAQQAAEQNQGQAVNNQANQSTSPYNGPDENEPAQDIADMPTVLIDQYTNPVPVPP